MLRFFFGKELTERIVVSLESAIAQKTGKAIDDKNKINIEERKLGFEQEKFLFLQKRK